MELCLNIDAYGRTVAPLSDKTQVSPSNILDYTTNSFFFEHLDEKTCNALIQDCKVTTTDDLPLTFWLSAQDEPRCLLERFAKDIFMHHTKKLKGLNSSNCGCEWWVQFRPTTNTNRINSRSQEAQEGIEFHWDKDEALRDAAGVFVHPHLSTVTYLTDNGAPTMVFDDSMPDERLMDRGMKSAFVSWPRKGKHLVFDGRFLHGAPSNLLPKEENIDVRVTFLVNIWLHHKPLGVESFPVAFLHKLRHHDAINSRIVPVPCSRRDIDLQRKSVNAVDSVWGLGEFLSIHARMPVSSICEERKREDHHGNTKVVWASSDLPYIRTTSPEQT